jgi:Rod binding domain-containing protein
MQSFGHAMQIPPIPAQTRNLPGPSVAQADQPLWAKAKQLEAGFLTEMLGHAGLGAVPNGFGGGIGEEQFASFLRAEQAKAMVEKGGVGLAQHIFESLQKRAHDAD